MKKEYCYIAGPISFTKVKTNKQNIDEFILCESFLNLVFPKWKLLNPVRWEAKRKWRHNLENDIHIIMKHKPKHIVLLPFWDFSTGAKIEASICRMLYNSNVYLFKFNDIKLIHQLIKLKNFKVSYNYDFKDICDLEKYEC